MEKAIFLDKDGTVIINLAYNANPDLIRLESGVTEGLGLLKEAGFKFIIVSNQAGVAHGYFEEKELVQVQQKIKMLLGKENIPLDGFYYCPHHPKGRIKKYAVTCDCRKPASGMLLKAAGALNIDVTKSWMIGDILDDVEAGNHAGCRTVLLDRGNETVWRITKDRIPYLIAPSINEAAKLILNEEKQIITT